MKLRAKTLFIITATFGCLTLLLALTARIQLMAGVDAVEAVSVRENLERARSALLGAVGRLAEITRGYAVWDETYAFVRDPNPEYLVRQLPSESQATLGVRIIALFDIERALLHQRLLDFEARRQLEVPPELLRSFSDTRLLVSDEAARRGRSGILVRPEGAWLVAASPILDNSEAKPARGTLVMGRPLDTGVVRGLADTTHLDMDVRRLGGSSIDSDLARSGMLVTPLSNEALVGRALVRDVFGEPALALEVRQPRVIYQRARTTTAHSVGALGLLGLVFGATMLGLFHKAILSRLQALAERLREIREDGRLTTRVAVTGGDEIAELGASVNGLLDTIAESQRDLSEGRERYRQLFYGNPQAMFVYDPETRRFLDVNDAALAQYGYGREEFLAASLERIHLEEDREALLEVVNERAPELRRAGIWRHKRRDGSVFSAEILSNSLLYAERPARLVLALDVSGRLRAEQALRASEERYALAARAANDGLWDWDVMAGTAYFSPRWKAMLGHGDSEIDAKPEAWSGRVHPEDAAALAEALDADASGTPNEHEHRILHKDGRYLHVLARWVTQRGEDGAVRRRVGSLSDITARKQAEDQLRREALYDALTGLPNRALLHDRLRRALARAKRHPEQACGLLFLDLDRFKVVNDSLGHTAGDQLLREVARRIERSVRPEDTVARLGGDEFTVLLDSVRGPTDATHAAERIQAELGRAVKLGELEVFTGVSIGIAISTPDYSNPEDLIRDADIAMYRAKGAGKARHEVFDSRMHEQAMTTLKLENDLRRALERSELEVYYQPIVELAQPDIVGFEALLRWRHPTRGLVMPAAFIPIAEETGLIVPIGRWVLERACEEVRGWQESFPRERPLALSVNLSARQLADSDMVVAVEKILKRTGFPPTLLHLEITESVIMQQPDLFTVMLGQLKDLGVRLSIDDFGTGYSSLSYLHLFPVDSLKIDRSFVSSMQALGKQKRIVETIVMLARSLGIDVIAEGVEGEDQRAALCKLGCGLGQGYLFSRPVDAPHARLLAESGHTPDGEGSAPAPS